MLASVKTSRLISGPLTKQADLDEVECDRQAAADQVRCLPEREAVARLDLAFPFV
jgi:hypothetical protein